MATKLSAAGRQQTAPRLARFAAKHIVKPYQLWLMLLPAIIVVFIFNYIPMYGIQLAFRDYVAAKGLTGGPWVGMKYIAKFVNSFQFWNLIRNTLTLSGFSILVGFPMPIFLALMLNQIKSQRTKKVLQTTVYFPHFISTVVMVGLIVVFLSPNTGVIGNLLSRLGYEKNLLGADGFVPVFVLTDVWQHAGWGSIIYLAALSTVDTQLYDACIIDGAKKWQVIWHIDIPCLIPTIIILFVLSMGNILGVGFEKAFLMQNNLNLTASEVIATYVYKIGITSNQYSYSAAIGVFNTAVNFIFLTGMNYLSKKVSHVSLW